jgi:hypothetical protein
LHGRSLSHGIERSHQITTAVRATLGSVAESIFGQDRISSFRLPHGPLLDSLAIFVAILDK